MNQKKQYLKIWIIHMIMIINKWTSKFLDNKIQSKNVYVRKMNLSYLMIIIRKWKIFIIINIIINW